MGKAEYEIDRLVKITNENWRQIVFEGVRVPYLISETGKLYSIRRHAIKKWRQYKDCQNQYVELYIDGRKHFTQASELMLKAFPEKYSADDSVSWSPIEIDGETSDYEVSDQGEVRRVNNHRKLKPTATPEGYLAVRLRHNGKTVYKYIHRLVAVSFVANTNAAEFDIVNHKDENRSNNNAINLEWCNKSYNFKYSYYRKKGLQYG